MKKYLALLLLSGQAFAQAPYQPPIGLIGGSPTLAQLNAQYPPATMAVGQLAFTSDQGLQYDTGTAWAAGSVAGAGNPGGSSGQIQYNNGGVFGGLAVTGTGSVVKATSPTLVTPALGVPTAIDLTNATNVPNNSANTSGTAANLSGNQTANYIYAGPGSGSAAAAAFRAMVAADFPLFSGLSAGSALAGSECIPMTQAGADLCTTVAAILTYTEANLPTIGYAGLTAATAVNGKNDLIANASAADGTVEKVAPNFFKWRSTTLSTATSITPNCDLYDIEAMDMTGTGGTFTLSNPSCTPVMGQLLEILLQTTNSQTMAYGNNVKQGTCLSTTSGSSKSDRFKLFYDGLQTQWECTADGSNF